MHNAKLYEDCAEANANPASSQFGHKSRFKHRCKAQKRNAKDDEDE